MSQLGRRLSCRIEICWLRWKWDLQVKDSRWAAGYTLFCEHRNHWNNKLVERQRNQRGRRRRPLTDRKAHSGPNIKWLVGYLKTNSPARRCFPSHNLKAQYGMYIVLYAHHPVCTSYGVGWVKDEDWGRRGQKERRRLASTWKHFCSFWKERTDPILQMKNASISTAF